MAARNRKKANQCRVNEFVKLAIAETAAGEADGGLVMNQILHERVNEVDLIYFAFLLLCLQKQINVFSYSGKWNE